MISLYHHNKCHVATTEPVAKAIFFAKMNKSLRIRISISFKCLLTTWRVIVVTQPRDNSIQNGLCLLLFQPFIIIKTVIKLFTIGYWRVSSREFRGFDGGPWLETSALNSLSGGQFTLSTQLMKLNTLIWEPFGGWGGGLTFQPSLTFQPPLIRVQNWKEYIFLTRV